MAEQQATFVRGRTSNKRLAEALALAVIVGGLSYYAGYRKGRVVERQQAERSGMPSDPHAGMGGMGGAMGSMGGGMAGPQMGKTPSMDLDTLREKLAAIDDRDELIAIANQHLDQARDAGGATDPEAAERRFTIAVAAYERADELAPNDPNVITDLGIALRGLGDSEGAVKRFRQAADADPKHPQSRYNLGLVLRDDLKRDEEAVKAWQEYLEVAPKDDPGRETVEKELAGMRGD